MDGCTCADTQNPSCVSFPPRQHQRKRLETTAALQGPGGASPRAPACCLQTLLALLLLSLLVKLSRGKRCLLSELSIKETCRAHSFVAGCACSEFYLGDVSELRGS